VDMLDPLAARTRNAHARRHGLLVDVQPRAPLDQSFHAVPPVVWRIVARRSLVFTTLLYVLEATMRGAGSSRVRLKPDSRYQVVPTSTGPRRDPHTAISSCGVSRRLMGTPPRSRPTSSPPFRNGLADTDLPAHIRDRRASLRLPEGVGDVLLREIRPLPSGASWGLRDRRSRRLL